MSVSMIEKARSFIVLDHPFFASILLRHKMVANTSINTLQVSVKGQISYNPTWVETLPLKQVIFALCHEVLHYASTHGLRMGHRELEMWNEACDGWINETLVASDIGEPIEGCIRMPGAEKTTPENLYDILQQRKKQPKDGDGPGGQPPPSSGQWQPAPPGKGKSNGNGKGQPPPPAPDPLANDIEPPPPGQTQAEQEAETKLEIAEAAQAAKMRGNLPGLLQKFVADTIDTKLPWFDLLERFMTEKVCNDYSWARPNRRYMPEFYLPVLDGVGAMGEVVFIVDISGSVSKQEIAHYNGHQKGIIELCRPSKVHVLYVDTAVQLHEEFDTSNGEEVTVNFHSGGGTRMEAGLEYIEKMGIAPVCTVVLTDAYDTYRNSAPDFPVVWCVSTDAAAPPYGETIRFSIHDEKR